MSSLFFDLQNGISGDMAVAALLSLAEDREGLIRYLKEKLHTLSVSGYKILPSKEQRHGIWGYTFTVQTKQRDQESRDFNLITTLIERSALENREKTLASAIFKTIAQAESKVHGVPIERVHFHEIGAIDSIVDVISFSVLYLKLEVKKSFASPIALGSGKTRSLHGEIPVPAPATLEIIKGMPVYGTDRKDELTTPTGAAIIKNVTSRFGPLPQAILRNIGVGFGKKKKAVLNALRILEFDERQPQQDISDIVVVVDATIDDSTPEEVAYLQEELFSAGALDVFITPVYMKKNRPGFNVTTIIEPHLLDRCTQIILLKSSSFGLRFNYHSRKYLHRKISKIETEYGRIAVKIGIMNGKVVKIVPEYEDCRKAALRNNLPIRTIFDLVKREAERQL